MFFLDLGIAFEQGKILPTPETVPFRLTRDIIDGFGPSGVEGTFRKSAEATMRVLRSNKDAILTILEVLMFDPLYNWSLTPAQAYRIQHGKQPPEYLLQKWENFGRDGKNTNKLAERALLRVTQKLEGREEGSKLSVEGQVNSLIQQATDPNNLALLFAGWQAYVWKNKCIKKLSFACLLCKIHSFRGFVQVGSKIQLFVVAEWLSRTLAKWRHDGK